MVAVCAAHSLNQAAVSSNFICSKSSSQNAPRRLQDFSGRTRRRICVNATERSSDNGGTDFLEDLTRDEGLGESLEAFEKRRAERPGWGEGLKFQPESLQQSSREQTVGDKVKDAIDKVLIADFFFVCLALLLLIFGLGEKLAFSTTYILDLWLQGWTLVVQPAIGVLMAGALLSGGFSWFQNDILKEK